MKHLVEIDDKNNTGKHLLNLIKSLSKKNSGIDFLTDEEKEDVELVKAMKMGAKSGMANKNFSLLLPIEKIFIKIFISIYLTCEFNNSLLKTNYFLR